MYSGTAVHLQKSLTHKYFVVVSVLQRFLNLFERKRENETTKKKQFQSGAEYKAHGNATDIM